MKYLTSLFLAITSLSFADPGIMIEIDVIIDRPSHPQPGMGDH